MISDAELCSLLPDSTSAGAWRSSDHVVLQKQRDSRRFLEPQPPHSETSVPPETSCSSCRCTGPGLCAALFLKLHPCGSGYFPHKTMEQKVRTEDKTRCFCPQHEYTLGSQYSLSIVTKYGLGWCNTKLLAHQAAESDTCFLA